MKKAEARADPNALVQDTVNAMATPKNYRPAGSIYDDPVYGPMANSRSPEFAMKARNLDNMVNQARIADQIRGEAQENRIAMEEGKLRFQEIEHARRPYAPDFQSTGVDPKTGMAVDAGGAFTGEGKQAEQVGAGPQMEAEPEAQMTPQDKAKLAESYSKMLADINMPDETKALIRQALPQLLPGGGQTAPGGEETPPMEGARKAPDGKWYKMENGQWNEVLEE